MGEIELLGGPLDGERVPVDDLAETVCYPLHLLDPARVEIELAFYRRSGEDNQKFNYVP